MALERYELDRARRIRLGVAQVAIFLGIAAFAFLACEAYLLAAIVAAVAAAKAVETESHMAP